MDRDRQVMMRKLRDAPFTAEEVIHPPFHEQEGQGYAPLPSWIWPVARIGIGTGLSLTALCFGISWGARATVEKVLLPRVDASLEQILNRQVELGHLSYFWPWHIHLGRSQIENLANIRSIDIRVDLGKLLRQRQIALRVDLNQPHVLWMETVDRGWQDLDLHLQSGEGSAPPLSALDVHINGGTLTTASLSGARHSLDRIQASTRLDLTALLDRQNPHPNSITAQLQGNLSGRPLLISAQGDLGQRSGHVDLKGNRLPLQIISDLAPQRWSIESLEGTSDLQMALSVQPEEPLRLQGVADVEIPQLQIGGVPQPIQAIQGQIRLDDNLLSTSGLLAQYGQISGVVGGTMRWKGENSGYQLQAELHEVTLQQIQDTLGQTIPLAVDGSLTGQLGLTGELSRPRVTGDLRSTTPTTLDELTLSQYSTRLIVENRELILEDLSAETAGGQVLGSGHIQLRASPSGQFRLQGSGLDVNGLARSWGASLPLALGLMQTQAQIDIAAGKPKIEASWQTTEASLETQGQLQFGEDGSIQIPQAQVRTGQGQATLSAQIDSGQFQAQVQAQELDLGLLADVLPRLSGDISLQAPLQDLGLDTLRAEGFVTLPEGVAGLPGPIQGQAAWDGSGISIAEANHGSVQVQGRIPIDPQTLALGSFDLAIKADDVPVTQVNQIVPWIPAIPAGLSSQGQVDLAAHLNGELETLQLVGTLGLGNLQAGGLSFTGIQGPIRWSRSGETQVDLQGNGDQIAVALGENYRLQTFQLQQGEASASGTYSQDQIQVQVNDLPLQLLNDTVVADSTPDGLSGTLNGAFGFDLSTQTAQGEAHVDALRLSELEAKQVAVAFQYQPGKLTIPEASLQAFDSRYELKGDLMLPNEATGVTTPHVTMQITTSDSRLQDIVSTFKWKQWSDIPRRGLHVPLGPASTLATDPIETLGLALPLQLDRFREFTRRLDNAAAAQSEPLIPPPDSVSGTFQAQVTVAGSLSQPQIGFQLQGQNWSAQDFGVEAISISGSVSEGSLHLQSLQLQSGERSGSFSGWVGMNRQEGKLEIDGLPLDVFDRFLPETVDLAGDLYADFDLAGNWQDPQATGTLALIESNVNQIPVENAEAQFTYGQGILTVDSSFQVDAETVQIFGTVPYTLPFAQVKAASPQIDLNLEMPDKALDLANLFTDQFAWESGNSELELSVSGTVSEPQLQGKLSVSEGVAHFKALSDPITNVGGEVTFNVDSLTINQISGNVGGGNLLVTGNLPVNSRGALNLGENFTPLSLTIDGVTDLSLANDFYQGGLEGLVTVEGLLLKPVLGGFMTLANGRVDLARGNGDNETTSTEQPLPDTSASLTQDQSKRNWPLQFNGLDVSLGSNLKVVRGQLLDFVASGTLELLGTLQDPRPAGTIAIEDGRFDLPIAPFRLDKSQTNQAVFDVDHGFDPFLDVHLFTRITELPLADSRELSPFDDRQDPRLFGEQQQIEISATVQGRASEITSSDKRAGIVNLSSTPPRSEQEIFAILGGNALATLGSSAGVASLAGQEVLNQIQEFTSLDEIRLTPIQQVSSDAPSTSAISLGLELVKDVGNNLSVSGLINITDEIQPSRYSFRYRLNSQTLLRLTTDLEGNDIASVEFGTRF